MADIEVIQEMRENIFHIKMNQEKFIETNELKMKILENKIEEQAKRIEQLEDTNKWMWRTILGTIICAVMALILKIS